MSYYDYVVSREIDENDYPFYALIMAAMRKADDNNLKALQNILPDVWQELKERYNLPGGKRINEGGVDCG